MVTLAVLAIALSVGVPTYQSLTAQSSISSAGNDLLAALALARSEALKRDATVSLQAICRGIGHAWRWLLCGRWQSWQLLVGSLIRRFGAPLNDALNVVISGGVSHCIV